MYDTTLNAADLITNHWSEKVQAYRPVITTPTANPAQTNCPHLTGTFVHFHELGFASNTDFTLPENSRVLVHSSCSSGTGEPYGVITVPATTELIFGDAPINFQAKGLRVMGKLLIGSATCRLRSKITITLHGRREDQVLPGPQWTKGIYVTDGTIEIHGVQYAPTWSRIARTIMPGDTWVLVQDMVNWEEGQTLLVTTTELKDSRDYHRNEERTIAEVRQTNIANVAAVRVTQAFAYKHYAGRAYQAEVALLSRRILVQGDPTNSEPTDATDFICYDGGDSTYPCNNKFLTGFGGHIRAEGSATTARFSGVELFRMGQTNQLGRYALHFHMILQNVPAGRLYAKDCSVHRSYFRAYAIHGTNSVVLSQNVAYDIIGHAYFLEDGVEENNVLEYNLGALVHWLGDTQRQSERFGSQELFWVEENPNMILPSDSTAAVYYITNSYNTFIGNAASGGWAGFAFPNLPRPVKLHENYGNGKYSPMSRPLIAFNGNTAHSTAYWFGSAGGVYVGGTLRHKTPGGILEYTGGRQGSRSTCAVDIFDTSQGQDGYCNAENELYMTFRDVKVFLANRGMQHWGDRSEVINAEFHDVGMSANVFGKVYLTNMLVQCRTLVHNPQSTCPSRFCEERDKIFYSNFAGFQWYDVGQTHIMTNSEFRNCNAATFRCSFDWSAEDPGCQWASIFMMLTHSDEFVPEVMQATRNIRFTSSDTERTVAFTVDQTAADQTVSGRLTNWMDMDGTVFPDAFPGQPVILGSAWANKWWKTSEACLGPKNDLWICPRNQDGVGSLYLGYDPALENEIGGSVCSNGDETVDCPVVGQVTHFGRLLADGLLIGQNSKITGPILRTSGGGWFVQFQQGTPKTLSIQHVQLHPDESLILAFPYPTDTAITVIAYAPGWCQPSWGRCQDTLKSVGSLAEVRAGFGDRYYFDRANKMLYIRAVQTDDIYWERYPPSQSPTIPGPAWPKRAVADLGHLTRDGITLMSMEGWEFRVEITASNCGGTAKYCAPVQVNPPAGGTLAPFSPRTFAPSRLRTFTPTSIAPTPSVNADCVTQGVQCSGGGANAPWEKCCFPEQECVKTSVWWGACQRCLDLDQECSNVVDNVRWTRCCQRNYVCTPQTATRSTCKATGSPVGPPTTRAPTTNQPSKTPTSRPSRIPSRAPTRKPTSKAPTSRAPSKAPTVRTSSPTTASPFTRSPVVTNSPVVTSAPVRPPTLPITRTPTKRPTKRRRRRRG